MLLLMGFMAAVAESRHLKMNQHSYRRKKHSRGLKMKSYNPRSKYIPRSRNLRPVRPQRQLSMHNEPIPFAQDAEFREAWKSFKAAKDPSVDLFSAMNNQINKEIQKKRVIRNLADVNPTNLNYERALKEGELESAPEDAQTDNKKEENSGDDKVTDTVDRLLSRTSSINDKIDHILFHNHHDLSGLRAHYTPYGVQILPEQKPQDSVDQKLKMIDYMHNLGGGYNPMLHSMLPYYLGQAGKTDDGIPYSPPMRSLKQSPYSRVNRYI